MRYDKLSRQKIKSLWFRDKAYLLKEPSIDRLNSSKDYTYGNCRFIEKMVNTMNGQKRFQIKLRCTDRLGKLIGIFPSIKETARQLGVSPSTVYNNFRGIKKSIVGLKFQEVKNG